MSYAKVKIHVVPSGLDLEDVSGYDPVRDGKLMSTANNIKVNRTPEGFTVVYDDETFCELQPSRFIAALIQLFAANLPGTAIDISVIYHYDIETEDEFDSDTANAVLIMDEMFRKIVGSGRIQGVSYTQAPNMGNVYRDWNDEMTDGEEDDESDDDDDREDEEDDDDPLAFLKGFGDESYYEDDRPKHREKKKNKEYYGRSRVWKNCKNPKKCIRRHGVLIAADKDDLKKDEKIIKEFLKDFLPGSSGWKKEFRHDLAKRWINMYAISKKTLRQLEKEHRKNRAKKNRKQINTDKALDFTRRLFSVPVDRWSDPTK